MTDTGTTYRPAAPKRLAALATAAALALAAAPAGAGAAKYKGKTAAGSKITFKQKGKKISKVRAIATTFCGQIGGNYGSQIGFDIFAPPGAFKLGKKGERKSKGVSGISGSEHTFTHKVLARKAGKKIKGQIELFYSYSTYDIFTNQIYFVNCSSTSKFTAKRR